MVIPKEITYPQNLNEIFIRVFSGRKGDTKSLRSIRIRVQLCNVGDCLSNWQDPVIEAY